MRLALYFGCYAVICTALEYSCGKGIEIWLSVAAAIIGVRFTLFLFDRDERCSPQSTNHSH